MAEADYVATLLDAIKQAVVEEGLAPAGETVTVSGENADLGIVINQTIEV